VFKSFGDAVIDSSGKKEDVGECLSYIKEIITHYAEYLSHDDCEEVIQVTFTFLGNLNDYILDNHNLLDIWSNILYLLVVFQVITYKHIEKLSGLDDDQVKCAAEVICKSLNFFDNNESKAYEKEIMNTTIYKANKNFFNEYLKY